MLHWLPRRGATRQRFFCSLHTKRAKEAKADDGLMSETVGRQDLASASSLQLMPEMAVDVSQRAAAADSLARWLEQKKEIRLQQEQRGGGKELQDNLGGSQCNNTVIKVTPKGLRKITLFEENFKQ